MPKTFDYSSRNHTRKREFDILIFVIDSTFSIEFSSTQISFFLKKRKIIIVYILVTRIFNELCLLRKTRSLEIKGEENDYSSR